MVDRYIAAGGSGDPAIDAVTTFDNTDLVVVEVSPTGTAETVGMTLANFIDNYQRRQTYTITRAVVSNNVTVAIKDGDGNNATAAKPLYFTINGTPRKLAGSLSLTINAGADTFALGSVELANTSQDLIVYIGWRASDSSVFMLLSRMPYANYKADFSATTTNERYGAFTGSTPAAADRVECIGRVNIINSGTASFNWSVPIGDLIVNHPVNMTTWMDWNPVASANGSMTYTTVGITYARYRFIDDMLTYEVFGTGTTGGTANTQLQCTYPFEPLDAFAHTATTSTRDATSGSTVVGTGGVSSAVPGIFCRKLDNSVYGLGTGRVLQSSGFYPVL